MAVRLAAGYGLVADEWQADVVATSLAKRRGFYAASTVGQAVPRQNGKNAWLEIRELFGMAVLGERVLHTAHEVKTARKAFRRLKYFFGSKVNDPGAKFPELNRLVTELRAVNGQEAIYLSNGGSWELIARSSGSGRGFDGIDLLVLDEAQDLVDEELAALLPTISAATLGNPQTIYTGTPPDPGKAHLAKGEVFRRVRQQAQTQANPEIAFIDWGVPDGPLPDVDDDRLVESRNPGMAAGRLTWREVRNERTTMSPEQFARERMGWWGNPDEGNQSVINLRRWGKLANKRAPRPRSAVISLDVSPDRRSASIGVATQGPKGKILVLAHTAGGTSWVVPRLKRILAKQNVLEVSLYPRSQAAILVPDLAAEGIDFETLTTQDMGQSCAEFIAWVEDKRLVHVDQDELNAAVGNAKTRYSVEAELWDRRDRSIDISPLVAVSAAAHRWALLENNNYELMDSVLL